MLSVVKEIIKLNKTKKKKSQIWIRYGICAYTYAVVCDSLDDFH